MSHDEGCRKCQREIDRLERAVRAMFRWAERVEEGEPYSERTEHLRVAALNLSALDEPSEPPPDDAGLPLAPPCVFANLTGNDLDEVEGWGMRMYEAGHRAGVEAMRVASIEVAESVGTSNFAKVHRLSVNVAARKLTGGEET